MQFLDRERTPGGNIPKQCCFGIFVVVRRDSVCPSRSPGTGVAAIGGSSPSGKETAAVIAPEEPPGSQRRAGAMSVCEKSEPLKSSGLLEVFARA